MTRTAPPPDSAPGNARREPSARMRAARTFVHRIGQRCAEDRGTRAALRSGLGKPMDRLERMHRIVAPLLDDRILSDVEEQRAYYAVAAMVALTHDSDRPAGPPAPDHHAHLAPKTARYGTSLGRAFADAVAAGTSRGIRESAAETRLNLLTRQSATGLHRHLPSAVRQLHTAGVAVDFARLLSDIRSWRRYRGDVSRRWLQDFYSTRNRDELQRARAADPDRDPGSDTAD
ncbi:type I-E CRISPR-associated protein Cse2/CasB [Streptomonospora wellingtoniae]|uniref:Type I-E CRISPR-associated protein Cse2/CasB n=1 Tax=Streptomonospora wellingtoniae TaxID=3075544 RepID=A0ABU2KNQ6_9ACTN|nr:type I-E CRISPR-associated protein Cse2/CasB [Streptomonospora sp. DSM 45055]MDT0300832.1 type I-E CRISPR-associated protein Cse2/CasB [Streptomonospora sp. DSM 45055]